MRKSARNVQAIALAAAAVLVAEVPAYAARVTWDAGPSGTGTVWSDAANWSGDVVPGDTDVAEFSKVGTAVTLGGGCSVLQLSIADWDNKTRTFGSAGETLTLSSVYRGSSVYGNTQTIAANVALASDSGWNLESKDSSGAFRVTGAISGTGRSLAKTGGGTLELSGSNTFGTTIVNSGTIKLDFGAGNAPASNILNSASVVTLGGGALQLTGKANTTNSQTINGLTVAAGGSSLSISNNSASNPTLLSLGAIARNVGGTVNFSQPSNGAISATNGYTTSTPNDAGGILGGYATVGGNNWATSNGTNIVALGSYTDNTWAPGTNTNVAADASLTGATTHSLRFNSAAARTLTLNGTNVVTSGGIMVTSSVSANATAITGGTVTSGAGDLVVYQNNSNAAGAMTISSTIADNGASPVALTKAGAGNLILSGTQTYTGGTFVNGGTLTLTAGSTNQLSTTGKMVVSGGTLALGAGTNQSTTGDVVVRGGSMTGGTVTKSNGSYDIQEGSVSTVLAGSAGLQKTGAGSASLSGANTYTGDTSVLEGKLSVSSNKAIKGNLVVGSPDGGLPASFFGSNAAITDSSSKSITVYQNGSVSLGAEAQHTNGGVFVFGGSFNGAHWYSNSTITMQGGSVLGTVYGNDNITIKALANTTPATVSAYINRSYLFDVEDGAGLVDMAFSGTINGASKTLKKTGAGLMRVTGANTYTGATTVDGGTLWVTGAGSVNSTSGITVNNAAILEYDSSVALTKVPTLNNTATFIYNSPAKLGGAITIASGRTLGGSGTFAGVTVNGSLKPGNSPGQMTVDSLVLGGTATTTMEIGGDVLGADYDNVTITSGGSLQYGGALEVIAFGGFDLTSGSSYSLFTLNGVVPTGDFASVTVAGQTLTGVGGVWTGGAYTFTESTGVLTVPEPSMLGLVAGTLCFGLARRQRKLA